MCKETKAELKEGNKLAKRLIEHLGRMGAAQCEIPVKMNNIDYVVKIEQIKHLSSCAIYNEPAYPKGKCNCQND